MQLARRFKCRAEVLAFALNAIEKCFWVLCFHSLPEFLFWNETGAKSWNHEAGTKDWHQSLSRQSTQAETCTPAHTLMHQMRRECPSTASRQRHVIAYIQAANVCPKQRYALVRIFKQTKHPLEPHMRWLLCRDLPSNNVWRLLAIFNDNSCCWVHSSFTWACTGIESAFAGGEHMHLCHQEWSCRHSLVFFYRHRGARKRPGILGRKHWWV